MNILRADEATELLAQRAAAILLRRWGRRVLDLRVEARAEGLVLYGRASTYYTKQLAQHAVAEAAGQPVRVNAIEVV